MSAWNTLQYTPINSRKLLQPTAAEVSIPIEGHYFAAGTLPSFAIPCTLRQSSHLHLCDLLSLSPNSLTLQYLPGCSNLGNFFHHRAVSKPGPAPPTGLAEEAPATGTQEPATPETPLYLHSTIY